MSEHPPRPDADEQLERERQETTDLGYRDTEEERAYEEAQDAPPAPDDAPPAPDDAAPAPDDAPPAPDDAASDESG